jgi:hypothetical protein
MRATWLFMGLLVACGGDDSFRFGEGRRNVDEQAPRIQHTFDDSPRLVNEPVSLSALVTDQSEIEAITLYYQREQDGGTWQSVEMDYDVQEPAADDDRGVYSANATATIPASFMNSAGVRYYIYAADEWGFEACSPTGCAQGAYYFPVVPPRQ